MRRFFVSAGLMAAMVLGLSAKASAVPSFARQTGMVCIQCHVSFGGPVPNFTFTGKKFRMNGYRMPYVAEKLEAGEPGTASGHRLAIPLIPYLSFRYQSVFASQSKAAGDPTSTVAAVKNPEASPISSNPTSRFSFFPGGALGDNFGLWVEVYLTPDGSATREWTLGLFSFDEYDLRLVKITDKATLGLSFSNQTIKEISGFGPFPTLPSNLTRGGFSGWSHPNRGNVFAYGWWNDRLLTVIGASPGEDNLDWKKRNFQAQLAYAFQNQDENELWFNIMAQFGNDGIPIITTTTPNASRTWTYGDAVPGIAKTRSSVVANQKSYTSADIGDYVRIEPEVRKGFIDRGPHSMEAVFKVGYARETYADNSEVKQVAPGFAIRYMYDRTWGGDFVISNNAKFDLKDPTGKMHELKTGTAWTVYGKYQPAMNFLMTLQVNNSLRGYVTNSGLPAAAETVTKGWSWSLGADILF